MCVNECGKRGEGKKRKGDVVSAYGGASSRKVVLCFALARRSEKEKELPVRKEEEEKLEGSGETIHTHTHTHKANCF